MRVAVIGAGIVGASVAFRLSQGGARVQLIDKAEPASGTTSASFAWVNANNKTPREYFDLNREGMEEHQRLREELAGDAPWLHTSGNLIQVSRDDPEELERRVERLRSWGYAAEWRSASQARELEPRVAFPDPDAPVAFFPEESWVDAVLVTKTLVDLARQAGAETYFGEPIELIGTAGGRVEEVALSDGTRLPVDAVVNAAGPDADRVAATAGRELPMTPKSGLLARVTAENGRVSRLIHTPRVNLRPDRPGHVLLHHGSVDEKLADGEPVELLGSELLERARGLVPSLGGGEVEGVRVGTRPIPSDGYPCVGGVADLPGYYEAVTHSGVTLGPLIGRLLAQEILTGEVDPLLVPFDPDRFGS
ncbi:MAG: FAD-binding oxidoreductase [Rubrobacteraceae bacterium]